MTLKVCLNTAVNPSLTIVMKRQSVLYQNWDQYFIAAQLCTSHFRLSWEDVPHWFRGLNSSMLPSYQLPCRFWGAKTGCESLSQILFWDLTGFWGKKEEIRNFGGKFTNFFLLFSPLDFWKPYSSVVLFQFACLFLWHL